MFTQYVSRPEIQSYLSRKRQIAIQIHTKTLGLNSISIHFDKSAENLTQFLETGIYYIHTPFHILWWEVEVRKNILSKIKERKSP